MIPVQFTISASSKSSAITLAKSAIRLGCKWLILQTDTLSDKDAEKAAKEIKKHCREQDVTFVIENNLSLIKSIDGDGVYLTNGQDVGEVRQELGEGFLIGTTASTAEEVIQKKKRSADYICCGPFCLNESSNSGLTLEDYKSLMDQLEEQDITLPICAYGSELETEHLQTLAETGVRGVLLLPHSKQNDKESLQMLEQFLNA